MKQTNIKQHNIESLFINVLIVGKNTASTIVQVGKTRIRPKNKGGWVMKGWVMKGWGGVCHIGVGGVGHEGVG